MNRLVFRTTHINQLAQFPILFLPKVRCGPIHSAFSTDADSLASSAPRFASPLDEGFFFGPLFFFSAAFSPDFCVEPGLVSFSPGCSLSVFAFLPLVFLTSFSIRGATIGNLAGFFLSEPFFKLWFSFPKSPFLAGEVAVLKSSILVGDWSLAGVAFLKNVSKLTVALGLVLAAFIGEILIGDLSILASYCLMRRSLSKFWCLIWFSSSPTILRISDLGLFLSRVVSASLGALALLLRIFCSFNLARASRFCSLACSASRVFSAYLISLSRFFSFL